MFLEKMSSQSRNRFFFTLKSLYFLAFCKTDRNFDYVTFCILLFVSMLTNLNSSLQYQKKVKRGMNLCYEWCDLLKCNAEIIPLLKRA